MQAPITRLVLRFSVLATSTDLRWTGVWYHVEQGGNGMFAHGAHDPADDSASFALKQQSTISTYSVSYPDTPPLQPGSEYTLTVDVEPGEHRMRIERSDGESGETELDVTIPPTLNGYVEAFRMQVAVAHLAIYTN
ncbi:MAG: hypothetical protein ACKV2T_21855 [Kofleriaceae bacterium]